MSTFRLVRQPVKINDHSVRAMSKRANPDMGDVRLRLFEVVSPHRRAPCYMNRRTG